MKKTSLLLLFALAVKVIAAQGWPEGYPGVMLQGFYWDSYKETSWSALQDMADELSPSFDLVWLPQSGYCNTDANMMGYTPVYYFTQHSSFGSEGQLRSLIQAFKQRGIGTIADVVVNHRANIGSGGSWIDYPAETYGGETYQMFGTDICRNDDGGATKAWADKNGQQLSNNNDTGEDWPGCRDLDHQSENVQRCVKAYLKYLLEDLGYTGFRYDMVKGFHPWHVGDYNSTVKPAFSVGEHWSSSWDIGNWINGTKWDGVPTSAAFDFQFRYRMRDAINNRNWRHLAYDEKPLARQNDYKRWAVTFVENHDTEKRSNDNQDPIWRDTLAANAYLLAMPGTPCVFWRHWAAYKEDIKRMIAVRKQAGITNTSSFVEKWTDNAYYAVETYGKYANLICVVGSNPDGYKPSSADYTLVLSGKGYRYYLSRWNNTVFANYPSGKYDAPIQVKLTALSRSNCPIVYTTDGTEPTTKSPQVNSGATLNLESSCTLMIGLLMDGKVVGTIARHYTIEPFVEHKITIYVQRPKAWTSVNMYVWDKDNTQLNGNWPGRTLTASKTFSGERWYYKEFTMKDADYFINVVLNTSSGSQQTIDLQGIRRDRYFRITTKSFGSKFVVDDVTEEMETGIETPLARPASTTENVYDLLGRLTPWHTRKGKIVVKGGRKVMQ